LAKASSKVFVAGLQATETSHERADSCRYQLFGMVQTVGGLENDMQKHENGLKSTKCTRRYHDELLQEEVCQ
jgi:hypothetical protein